MPASKSTPFRFQSFHQSQATLPGLIHEVSPIWFGVARAYTRLFIGISVSFSVIAITRQGYVLMPELLAIKSSVSST